MMPGTDELNISPETLTRAELRRVASTLQREEQTASTDYTSIPYEFATPRQRPVIWGVAAAVVTAVGSALHSRQPAATDTLRTAITRYVTHRKEERVADFFEVVEYNWSRELYRASVAVREYSEHIDADY